MKLAYLIQPYTISPEAAYEFALALIARETLFDSNTTLISPIVHYHEAAARHNLPLEFKFWLPRNFDLLRKADEVRVVCATGLLDSIGCIVEGEFAKHLQLPIRYYALDSIIQGPAHLPFQSIVSFDCLQPTRSYEKLLEQITLEMGIKRAREITT